MADLAAWRDVVRSALEEGVSISAGPVAGARLRGLVAQRAANAGLTFPDPTKTFGEFLAQFPDVVFVHRRPGRDMLVVPGDNVEMLSSANEAPRSSTVRQDFFEALTLLPRINEGRAVYLPSNDTVYWPKIGETPSADAVLLPEVTLERLLDERKEFAAQAGSQELRAALENSLHGQKPIQGFSEVLRAHGLARTWHLFRVGKVLARLKQWSQDAGLTWRSDWFLEGEQVSAQAQATAPGPSGVSSVQEFLSSLSAVLKEEDLARISIPLDLVAKAWSHRG